jgi:hypothetical protein
VVARGSTLELLRPDDATNKLVSVASMPTFSVIRSLKAFRLHGANRVLANNACAANYIFEEKFIFLKQSD